MENVPELSIRDQGIITSVGTAFEEYRNNPGIVQRWVSITARTYVQKRIVRIGYVAYLDKNWLRCLLRHHRS